MLLSVCTVFNTTTIASQAFVNTIMKNGDDNSCILYRQDISKYFIEIFLDPGARPCVCGIQEME
jgi:hypothetical protein